MAIRSAFGRHSKSVSASLLSMHKGQAGTDFECRLVANVL